MVFVINTTDLFKEVRNKLVSALPSSVLVKASYDGDSVKDMVVVESPDVSSEASVFSDTYAGEETVNVVVSVYTGTPKSKDDLVVSVKDVFVVDDFSGLSLIGISDVDNTLVVNDDKYFSKSVTFTFLASGD